MKGRSAVRLRSRATNFWTAAPNRYAALTGLDSIELLDQGVSQEDWEEQGVSALVTAHGDATEVLETAKHVFEEVAILAGAVVVNEVDAYGSDLSG
jgi:hypothetical protein